MNKKIPINQFFLVTLFFFISYHSLAQKNNNIGLEIQAYPTGIIPSIRYELYLKENNVLTMRLGYQFIRHRDLGKHDDERGTGAGFSLGYKKAISSHFFIHLRNDLWWNHISWANLNPDEMGTTRILVIQPTAGIEYSIEIGDGISLTPSVFVGMEWNAKTRGEPTGEGPIGLLGFLLAKKL